MTDPTERLLTPARAGREALVWEMERNPNIFFMGEDVVVMGGVFNTATGLAEQFPGRVIDTPISETGFFGIAAGAAIDGMHPVVELAFADFLAVCLNPIVNYAAKTHYMSDGQVSVPMTILIGAGGGYNNGGEQSQCLYSLLAHFPGIKVVVPSNSYDAKGLVHAAIRDPNPVAIMYHKATMGVPWLGSPIPTIIKHVPKDDYVVPLGSASVVREGADVTIVGLAWTVHQALIAADTLAERGVSAEVIDLRSLVPLDAKTLLTSVRRTGRLVVADEDYRSYGLTGEVIATVAEAGVGFKAPPRRVAYPDVPPPAARTLESVCMPSADKIVSAVLEML